MLQEFSDLLGNKRDEPLTKEEPKDEVKKEAAPETESTNNTQRTSSSSSMSSSELGQVVRADHDYIELLVNVKAEHNDEGESNNGAANKLIPIGKESLIRHEWVSLTIGCIHRHQGRSH